MERAFSMPTADAISWVDAAGAATSLSDVPNLGVEGGRNGLFMPGVTFVADPIPLKPGARLRWTQLAVRDVDLPLFVQAADAATLRARVRTLLHAFDPTRGDGTLRVVTVDGLSRDLACRYSGGITFPEDDTHSGVTWAEFLATFRAHDPYWYDTLPTIYTLGEDSPPTWFPIFPLSLGSAVVLGTFSATNPGDVDGWPVWTIYGPGDTLALTNNTTGLSMALSLSLGSSDVLVIDTREYRKSVVLNSTTNQYAFLTATSELWPLVAGANSISVTMLNTSGATRVVLSLQARYLSI